MSGARAAIAVALACATLPLPAAFAQTPARVAALASRAASDPGALDALRGIVRVDGHSADIAGALDVRGSALAMRLRVLAVVERARPAAPSAVSAAGAARAILAQRAYRGSGLPRPLHRPLSWLGGLLARGAHAVRPAVRWLAARIPGGTASVVGLTAAVVAAAAAAAAVGLGRRRHGRIVEGYARGDRAAAVDPRALEQAADEAEQHGEYEQALRLRFRSGLLRLAQRGSLRTPSTLTSGAIAARLHSATFEGIAGGFDEVVYGDRVATREDAVRARSEWRELLKEVDRA